MLSTRYDAGVSKVIQMDRRGHAMHGMDRVYIHITPAMRQRLCDTLEELWQQAIAERYAVSPKSAVPLLDHILNAEIRNVTLPKR